MNPPIGRTMKDTANSAKVDSSATRRSLSGKNAMAIVVAR